jgi:hypothetical protein
VTENNDGSREPNGFELQRAVERVEKNVHDGFLDMKVMMATMVSRDLFDFESRTQNDRILKLEKVVEKNEDNSASAKQRFWIQTVIPLLMVGTSIAVTIINFYHH